MGNCLPDLWGEQGSEDGVSAREVEPAFDAFDGSDFHGSYRLGRELGEGAFSLVREGTHRNTNKTYAIKCIKRDQLPSEDEADLMAEVDILKSLSHPNIIDIYQFYRDDPKYYFVVIEFMKGGELFNRIVKKSFYNEKEARDLCRIMLDSVKYMHDRHVVHRDLKPENLLLTSQNDDANIKIADFGFARSFKAGPMKSQCGTPGYVAPEILKHSEYTSSVDMWSIGVIIYILLGGYPPFHDASQPRLFRKIRAGSFRFHPEYWGGVSNEAKDLIRRLLTVDPQKRLTAGQAVVHPWLLSKDVDLVRINLHKNLEQLRLFNASVRLPACLIMKSHCHPRSAPCPIYQLNKELGHGNFSVVKEATHKITPEGMHSADSSPPPQQSGKKYAVKCIKRADLPKEDEEALFMEVKILKQLNHANIVEIVSFHKEKHFYYLVMEILKGGELFDRIVLKQYYNEKEARDVLKVLLGAISYCHDRTIVHRDLKPENLLLVSEEDNADLKVADFGFARPSGSDGLVTQCGTPGYVAPEILRGHPYGAPVDMWSVGVITFILLGGYPPFHDENKVGG
ncbi:unnamed protein product [Chrysoparadoxa australica]